MHQHAHRGNVEPPASTCTGRLRITSALHRYQCFGGVKVALRERSGQPDELSTHAVGRQTYTDCQGYWPTLLLRPARKRSGKLYRGYPILTAPIFRSPRSKGDSSCSGYSIIAGSSKSSHSRPQSSSWSASLQPQSWHSHGPTWIPTPVSTSMPSPFSLPQFGHCIPCRSKLGVRVGIAPTWDVSRGAANPASLLRTTLPRTSARQNEVRAASLRYLPGRFYPYGLRTASRTRRTQWIPSTRGSDILRARHCPRRLTNVSRYRD